MNWKNVKLIFLREVRDQLRDRRTLFMIAVLPLLLYPALGIGMMQMTLLFSEQPRNVLILGAENLPDKTSSIPALLDGNKFRTGDSDDIQRLRVFSDLGLGDDAGGPAKIRALIEQSAEVREIATKRLPKETSKETPDIEANRELSQLMADAGVQVLIIVPDGFAKNLEAVNRQIADRKQANRSTPEYPGLIVLRNSADEKSSIAYSRTKSILQAWEKEVLRNRLEQAKLPENLATPIHARHVEIAEKQQISASVWSRIFPALLVIMAVTGAFYPAVDLAAGEKERGTMETLLISPAARAEIVFGKFLTVLAFSMSTALLNLLSMGLTGKYIMSAVSSGPVSRMGGITAPSLSAVFWVILLLIPLAALFSALSLALATFARSSKEGQYYLTPLLMVTLGLTVFCLSPAVQMEPFYSVMPIVGPTLLLKQLLSTTGTSGAMLYALPVLVTSIGYSALALWWAVEQFSREDILFREAERFDLRLWVRHLLRDKEATPTFAEAVLCFVMIMLMQFGAMKFMNDIRVGTPPEEQGTMMIKLLMLQQLVIIATPAIMMGVILTKSPRRTFRLNLPSWRYVGLALGLALLLHPLSLELSAFMQEWFFPPLPGSVASQFGTISDSKQELWFILLAFAVAPAICEETAFRGFMLSGFNRTGRYWLAIVLSSAAFGLMHMIPQQVFNAALLGIVLGLLAIRSNSLLPGILFHLVYNSLSVFNGRFAGSGEWEITEFGGWFVTIDGGHLRYEWPLLILCGALGVVLLRTLVLGRKPKPSAPVPTPPVDQLAEKTVVKTG